MNDNNIRLSASEEELLNAALNSEDANNNTDNSTLIPTNPNTINRDLSTARFSGAEWYEQIQKESITVIGAGGIGSNFIFLISRLKPCHIAIYDPDTVEDVNMAGQFFKYSNIGEKKATAIVNNIREFSQYYNVTSRTEFYDKSRIYREIMVCGLDSMEARKIAYYRWKEQTHDNIAKKCLFIDGRLSLDDFQIFAITGDDGRAMREYEDKWLFKDSEAEELPCSQKQTTFMATMIASFMVNILINFVSNKVSAIKREVPFLTTYNSLTMFNKVVL